MDDIFAKKAWCNPVSTRFSTGLSTTRTEESNVMETDSECANDGDEFCTNHFYTVCGFILY